ncbi:MAG TPA: SbmA/BacA-like family transporter, partial [Rubrobacter sp.]|nr:SbmA/BacA-like family transporter [Rubrobacter sp.]
MYGTKFMRKLAVEIRSVLAIALPYFRSDERWSARILLGAVVALQLGGVGLTIAINAWNNAFYNALQEKDWGAFLNQLLIFCGLAAAYIIVKVYQLYLSQWLQIRWRRWMTDRYLDAWLSRKAHYRMHLLGQTADNPDQRISDDVHLFVSRTLNIGIELLGSVVSLASFAVVLWGLSHTVPLTIFGHSVVIPGYLVWGALFYAVLGTFVTHLIGRPLVRLNFDQQRYEADFRFALVRLRENSEEVALLGGEQAETNRLRDRFARVARNWYTIMSRQKQLTFFTAGYDQVATVFPYLVVSPLYFAGAMQLGGLMQTASAFSQVQTSLSFFVTAYGTLAEWKAVVERLVGFEHAIAAAHRAGAVEAGIEIQVGNGEALVVRDLVVMLPSGAELVTVPTLALARGERALISGPSSSGKSSLMRSLGGIWPFGAGQIEVPRGTRLLAL